MLFIGLNSEYILNVFGLKLTNSFLTTVLVTITISLFVLIFKPGSKKGNLITEGLRVIVYELLKLTDAVTKERELSKNILPIVSTFFVFIICSNLLALTPGFLGSFFLVNDFGNKIPILRSPNSDLTTTLALATISVLSIQFFSIKSLGFKKYISRFFNLNSPIQFILGFFEILSEGVKVLSFSMRLFGNIFAGEILLLVIAFLVPYIIPIPFMILEVFVGIIQAFIFAMLTLTFIKGSTISHITNKTTTKEVEYQ